MGVVGMIAAYMEEEEGERIDEETTLVAMTLNL